MLRWMGLAVLLIFSLLNVANSWGYGSPSIVEIGAEDGTVVMAEVVTSFEDRARGLMYRDALGDDKGMLFVFDTDACYAFWMKNMNFPIDILWLDGGMGVVDIATAEPCTDNCLSYVPDHPARYVLEVPAGFAAAHGISTGSILSTNVWRGTRTP